MLTQKELKKNLYYNKNTGIFIWIKNKNWKTIGNKKAGCKTNDGYITIGLNKKHYLAHRLAWLYEFGYFPNQQIDHINRIKNDNRICNLRDVNNAINQRNTNIRKTNKSGYKGIFWNKQRKKWCSKITVNYKDIKIKFFKDKNKAIKERLRYEVRFF